jgi:hypothetical protein
MKRENMGISYKQQTIFFNITTIYAYQLRFTSVSFPLRGWRLAAGGKLQRTS